MPRRQNALLSYSTLTNVPSRRFFLFAFVHTFFTLTINNHLVAKPTRYGLTSWCQACSSP